MLVPGERWEAALVARTQHSLRLSGVASIQYEYGYGDREEPRTYQDAVASLLDKWGSVESIIVPAGFIVDLDFGRLLRESAFHQSATPSSTARIPSSVTQPGPRRNALSGAVLQSMSEVCVERQNQPGAKAALGRHLRKQAGADLFQRLGASDRFRQCEPPAEEISYQKLSSIRDGWVYRCNNEPIELDLSAVSDCQTLVVVGAGVKPWWIANALRQTLKQMIVVDSHLPQLAFAHHAMQNIGQAQSWSALCDGLPFRSINDLPLRPLHDRIYRELRKTRAEWNFTTRFIAADLQSQTFGILDLLRTSAPGKTCLWYSNVFRPYTSPGHSEHHAGVEHSFLELYKSAVPGLVCFNTSLRPVQDPRSDRLQPDLKFRLRRGFDAVAARWRGHN